MFLFLFLVVKKGDKDVLLIRPSEGHKEHKKIEETEFGNKNFFPYPHIFMITFYF